MEAEELKKAVETKQQEVESIERNKTWNWENMCHVTEERTIINKSAESEVRLDFDLMRFRFRFDFKS